MGGQVEAFLLDLGVLVVDCSLDAVSGLNGFQQSINLAMLYLVAG